MNWNNVKKFLFSCLLSLGAISLFAQINTEKVILIGRNALYYEDYVLSIQYFNQVIKAKPHLAEPYYYRAIAKFLLDDNKGAEEDCTLCLEQNPFITNAYRLRGDARLNQENYDGAIEDYKQSLRIIPDNKAILVNMGIANIQKKDFDEAEKELDKLMKLYPTYTQGVLTRGTMFLERGDTVKALADYNKAIEMDKNYPQSYSMRGLVHYSQKRYEAALADFDEAIKLDPMLIGNYINRGLVKYSTNDLRGAMADYDRVIDTEPNNLIARFNRGLLRAQVGDDNRAIGDFDVVLQHEPDNLIAYLNRALLKSNTADYKGALADLNIVLAEYPDFYQGFYARADIKRKQSDLKGAERDLAYARKEEQRISNEVLRGKDPKKEKTREKSDKTIDKFNLLVVADKEEEQKSKYASETRGRIQNRQVKIELEPKFITSFYEKVDELKKTVHFSPIVDKVNKQEFLDKKLKLTNSEAPLNEEQIDAHFASINEYSKFIQENGKDPNLYFGRALDYMLVQDFTSAIADLNAAIKLDPKYTLAYFNLGIIYTKLLELKENVPTFDKEANTSLADIDKQTPKVTTLPSLSDVRVEKSEFEQAVVNYNKAIELNPEFVYSYYNRAEIRSIQKDYRAAVLDYNEVIRRDPEFAEAYYNRGLARLYMGEKQKGLDDLRKAGELGVVNAYSIVKRMSE